MEEDDQKKPGRKRIKKEPHKTLTASIPETLYDQFQELVMVHDGGNMTYVVKRLITQYIEEKTQ